MSVSAEKKDTKNNIYIEGAYVHNLKNVTVTIPKNKLIVITGLSGSGKSSLAFDTLYAEGQRRYVESLSAYVRQFLGRIDKPNVRNIEGITPAIAIEQKVSSTNPRSTVGTVTEIYDYLKLLFTRIGKTYSPVSGKQVTRDSPESILQALKKYPAGTKCMLFASVSGKGYTTGEGFLNSLLQQGFNRIKIKEEIISIEDVLSNPKQLGQIKESVDVLIDRFSIQDDDDTNSRMYDSLQTAFFEGEGECFLEIVDEKKTLRFNNRFELDGITFEEPNIHFFSFNNPLGACKRCEGFGSIIGIDPDLVVPNKGLSIYEEAVVSWKGEKMSEWKDEFVKQAHKFDFPVHKPYNELSDKQIDILWKGNEHVEGLNQFFKMLEANSYKIQYRVMLSRYRGKTICPDCNGARIRPDTNYVKIYETSISDIIQMPISDAIQFFNTLKLNETEATISKRLLIEINNRLKYLSDVGLGYLNLNRPSATLSGGESQRIHLATSLGSSLVGSSYILDEPSIGLHPRDGHRLIHVLKSLRDLGNTVLVVEHDEDMMREADLIIDMGPEAGSQGGELIFSGVYKDLIKNEASLTGRYLSGKDKIEVPTSRRPWKNYIELKGVYENNLKNVDVKFPLEILTVITGVSGSGKSTLLKKVLYPSLKRRFGGNAEAVGKFKSIHGHFEKIQDVEFIDQNPIGKSSRSNPATYVKAFDEIRTLFSNLQLSKMRGYKPSHFSFNVAGGRCDKCEGEGTVTIEMQFMADVVLECDVCKGQRFKEEILEIKYEGKNISDILSLTIDDAMAFFNVYVQEEKNASTKHLLEKISIKIEPLQKVGLGYLQLGQSSSSLSGGEAQRIKLASFLVKGGENTQQKVLFIFDEPSTGLHFHDIKKLLFAFNELIKLGHSILLIEHHLDIIKCADWIIDIGPEGGDAGGNIVFEGVPEDLVKVKESYTGKYLKDKI